MATESKHGLTEHPRGWVKKIHGQTVWIASKGIAPTAEAADRIYEERFAALWRAKPAASRQTAVITVRLLANHFLLEKKKSLHNGEIADCSYLEYKHALNDFCVAVGDSLTVASLGPSDFQKFRDAIAAKWGVSRRAKWTILVRSCFKWAQGAPLRIPAPDYGKAMRLPTKKQFRLARKQRLDEKGSQIMEPSEFWMVLYMAPPRLRLAILLGINCAFGPTDAATLHRGAIRNGWVEFGRSKTGIERRCPLWPETVQAMAEYQSGQRLLIGGHVDALETMWLRLLDRCGLRPRGFYCLRRTWRTLADEKGDPRAAARVMGHITDDDVSSLYVEHISDSRLIAVSDYVRHRLLPQADLEPALPALRAEKRDLWKAQLAAARRARTPRRPPVETASDPADPSDGSRP